MVHWEQLPHAILPYGGGTIYSGTAVVDHKNFLGKQTAIKKKRSLIDTMIWSLNIPKDQKKLYLDAVKVLHNSEVEELYKNLVRFVEKVEMRQLDQIQKENFSTIAGMRKKEAEEKMEEMNSFSFLLHNL